MFHFLGIKRYQNITNIYKHDGSPVHTKGCCSKQHRNHGTRPDLRKSISGRLEIPSPKSTVATQRVRPTVWSRSRFGKWSGPTCSIDKQTHTRSRMPETQPTKNVFRTRNKQWACCSYQLHLRARCDRQNFITSR